MSVSAMAAEVFFSEAVPNTTASKPSFTVNNNPSHTPQATGGITVPQSPAGTSTTNTGRNKSASGNAFQNGHSLKGWDGVRTPGNRA